MEATIHCFACNNSLSNPAAAYDVQTTRYYCQECFSYTIEEQLRIAGKDFLGDLEDLETESDTPLIEPRASLNAEEENDYF